MRSSTLRLFSLASVAFLVGGCEDPVEPDQERTAATTQGGPRPASDPQAIADTNTTTQLILTWPDNSTNETGWEIHRSTTGTSGIFSLLTRTRDDITAYTDGQLQAATLYCYRVRWFRASGKNNLGSFSNAFCGFTNGPPSAPTSAGAMPGVYAFHVFWTNTASTTTALRIQRSGSIEGPWTDIASPSRYNTVYEDTGRAVEQQVCYRIIASNKWGEAPSNVACTALPASPDSLKASSPEEHSVALTWRDRSGFEDGYEVQRSTDAFVWSVVATLPANAASYVDGGLTSDAPYFYKVRASRDGGFSDFTIQANSFTATSVPAAPQVSVIPRNSTTVDVFWWSSQAPEGYRVDRSTNNGATWESLSPIGGNLVDADRTSELTLHYRVVAFNRLGDSPPTEASTTPPAAPGNLTVTPIDEQTNQITWSDNSSYEDGYQLWLYRHEEPYYDDYYYAVDLPPNNTSYQAASTEQLYGVVALKDGGRSDWTFLPAEGAAKPMTTSSPTLGVGQ